MEDAKGDSGADDVSTGSTPSTSQEVNVGKPNQQETPVIVTIDHVAKKAKTVEEIKSMLRGGGSRDIEGKLGISFSGAGFLGAYHFGAVHCLQRNAKTLTSRIDCFAGSSVGSLLAALLAFEPSAVDNGLQNLYTLAEELHSKVLGALTPSYKLASSLCSIVDAYIPEDITPAQQRLFVSITRQSDKENRLVSSFESREHLLKCLMASCFIPYYSMGPYEKGVIIDEDIWIDGGFSNNLPTFKEHPTLTISPFSGSAMISPNDPATFDWSMSSGDHIIKVNLQNVVRGAQALFPPSKEALQRYYLKGYKNAMLWLIENDLIEREENGGTEI